MKNFDFYNYDSIRESLLTPRYQVASTDFYIPDKVLILNNPDLKNEGTFINQVTYFIPQDVLSKYPFILGEGVDPRDLNLLRVRYRGLPYFAVPLELRLSHPLGGDVVHAYANENRLLSSILMTMLGLEEETAEIRHIAELSLPILSRKETNT